MDTRCYDGEAVLRRRVCECGARWTTREVPVARTLTTVSTVVAVRPQRPPATPVRTHIPPGTPLDISTGSQPLVVAEVGKSGFLPLASPSGDPDPDPEKIRIPRANALGRSKPPTKPKAPQDPRVGEVFGAYRRLWQAKYRSSWVPEPGLSKNVTAMLKALDDAGEPVSIEAVGEWLAAYLADEREFLVDARHSLRLFCVDFNKYRAGRPARSGMSPREIQGVENTFAWLEAHGGKR